MVTNEYNEEKIIIKGLSVSVRTSGNPAAILITYDSETDLFMKLKFFGRKDVRIDTYAN